MNSDNYEFAKSTSPQGVDLYSPFTDKQWNYVNDINSGVYSNNSGLTQVQMDLTSIYNSGQFCNATDLFLTIPIVTCAAFVGGGALVAPVAGSSSLCTLKTNYQTLIHQIEVVANGKTVGDTQPFISQYTGFRMLSQMTTNDLQQWGSSLGFGQELDSEKSVQYTPVAAAYTPQIGVGLCNNRPFGTVALPQTDTQSAMNAAGQNGGAVNKSLQRRASRIVDTTGVGATSYNKVYGAGNGVSGAALMTATQLNEEFKPNYTVTGNIMTWHDLAIIPLKYLCDVVDKLGLVKKLDMILRIYFNTGSLQVAVANPNTTNLQLGAFSGSTFANTCPLSVNALVGLSADGGVPATTTAIVAGVFIARPPTTSIAAGGTTVNLGLAASHPMPSCRTYYSLIKLAPAQMEAYVLANREKQVVYENVIYNQYSNIGAGSTFSQLVQSGIKNPLAVAIIPFISPSALTGAAGSATVGFEQWQSPYDQTGGGGGYSPISLTNLSVQLGGVQVLNSSLYYTFENFLEQVGLAETLTSSDFGVGTGVISQSWWEMNRVYYVDLARGRDADKASMRNLSISFKNNSNAVISLMVFTIYLDRIIVDVETGAVRK